MLHTTAEVLSHVRKIENESAKFYEDLSQRYGKDVDVLLSFAKENGKNIVQVERAYYGVITDAIESCFAFNINPDDYAFETKVAEGASYSDALRKAVGMEEKIIKFYSDAAEQSKALMADVPRAMAIIAKKRDNRKAMLKSLLGKGT